MLHRAKRLSALLAVLLPAILTSPALGDPLVTVSVLGRIQGSGQDYSSVVTVTSTSQVLEYELVVEIANIGATGQVGYTTANAPIYETITSLVGAVTTPTTTTYTDGVSSLKFNLSQSPADPTQVNLYAPTLAPEWMQNIGWSAGDNSAGRGTTGCYDVLNIRPVAGRGVWLGVPQDGMPVPVVLGTGLATVMKVTPGTTSHVLASADLPTLISSQFIVGYSINGGISEFVTTEDADPAIGFNNLTLQTLTNNPMPPSVMLTAPSGGLIAGQGWQIVLSATATPGAPSTVTGVEMYVDGSVDIGAAAPAGVGVWTCLWDTSAVSLGTHQLTARATDSGGLTSTSSAVAVLVRLAGDGNGDNVVDGEDYGIWQNGYGGGAASFATGDYNGDGIVDGEDYGVWQNNYGRTSGTSDSVAATSPGDGTALTAMTQAPAMASAAVTPPASAGNAPRLIAVTPASGSVVRGVTSMVLVFDTDVQIGAGAVEVSGLATGSHRDYAAAYDAATRTLTLTWTVPLPADHYRVRVVADFVVGSDGGAPLDGEVGNPACATLPSGDGAPGGGAGIEFAAE